MASTISHATVPGPAGSHLTSMQLTDALLWRLSQESPGQLSFDELDILESNTSCAISTIRSLQNHSGSSLIHRLPPEILALIFRILHLLEKPTDYLPRLHPASVPPPFPPTPAPAWGQRIDSPSTTLKSITHVCRRWRQTALSFPSLWALVFSGLSSGQLPYRISLARSGPSVPLRVYIHGAPYTRYPYLDSAAVAEENTQMMEALGAHTARFEELHLIDIGGECFGPSGLLLLGVGTQGGGGGGGTAIAPTSAPLLVSLTLSFNSRYYQPFHAPTAPIPILFGGDTPKLRKLTLHAFTSWDSGNAFKDLTHLMLSRQHPVQRLPLAQFLAFLSASPQLEDLAIVDAAPLFDGSGSGAHQAVMLSHLRVLCIGAWQTASNVATFLACLVIPQRIELFIWGTGFQDSDDLPILFPLYANQCTGGGELTELRITHNPQRLFGNTLTWGSDGRYALISTTDGVLQLEGSMEPSQVLLAAPRFLGLESVQELWLGCQFFSEPSDEEWREFFAAVPVLRKLVICRRTSQQIISALTIQGPSSPSTPTSTPTIPPHDLLCPTLHTLQIYSDPSLSVLRLAILLEQRKKNHRPLSFLSVISLGPRHPPAYRNMPVPPPAALQADLRYLERYVERVEYEQKEVVAEDWEMLDAWPPPAFDWAPGDDD